MHCNLRQRTRPREHLGGIEPRGAQLADAGVAIRLAQLGAAGLPDKGVMQKLGHRVPPDEARQAHLAAG